MVMLVAKESVFKGGMKGGEVVACLGLSRR